jgi:hypothetical protein
MVTVDFFESEIYKLFQLLDRGDYEGVESLLEQVFVRWGAEMSDLSKTLISTDKNKKNLLPILSRTEDAFTKEALKALVQHFCPSVLKEMLFNKNVIPRFSLKELESIMEMALLNNVVATTMQNWIQKGFKELIGSPEIGKKYSIRQISYILFINDLNQTLDFDSIKKILQFIEEIKIKVNDFSLFTLMEINAKIVEINIENEKKLLLNENIDSETVDFKNNRSSSMIFEERIGNYLKKYSEKLSESQIDNLRNTSTIYFFAKNANLFKNLAKILAEDSFISD